jgi:hypothetical protein
VRYVLEGSVRRSGNQIRVNAQLIDAETDTHLWAERFSGDTSDLFALQDEITTLNLELIGAEAARPTNNPDAVDYILRGRAAWSKPPTREIRLEQVSLYERALALDPNSVEARSKLADALSALILSDMTGTPEADALRAEDLVTRAMAASPNSPFPHMAKATLLRAQRRFAEAIRDGARAQSKLGLRNVRSRPVQALHRVDRGDYPSSRTRHPAQPPRSRARGLVLEHWASASFAVAHGRGDHLVGERARLHSHSVVDSCLLGVCLWPQWRDRTRRRRARRSPQVER